MAVMKQITGDIEREVLQVLSSPANPIEKTTTFVKLVGERLRVMSPRIFGDLQRHYPAIWEEVERFRAEKIKHLIDIIVDGSQQGYFRPINPTIVTASFVAAVRAVVNPKFVLENNLSMEEAFRTVIGTFLYGIVTEKYSAYITPTSPVTIMTSIDPLTK